MSAPLKKVNVENKEVVVPAEKPEGVVTNAPTSPQTTMSDRLDHIRGAWENRSQIWKDIKKQTLVSYNNVSESLWPTIDIFQRRNVQGEIIARQNINRVMQPMVGINGNIDGKTVSAIDFASDVATAKRLQSAVARKKFVTDKQRQWMGWVLSKYDEAKVTQPKFVEAVDRGTQELKNVYAEMLEGWRGIHSEEDIANMTETGEYWASLRRVIEDVERGDDNIISSAVAGKLKKLKGGEDPILNAYDALYSDSMIQHNAQLKHRTAALIADDLEQQGLASRSMDSRTIEESVSSISDRIYSELEKSAKVKSPQQLKQLRRLANSMTKIEQALKNPHEIKPNEISFLRNGKYEVLKIDDPDIVDLLKSSKNILPENPWIKSISAVLRLSANIKREGTTAHWNFAPSAFLRDLHYRVVAGEDMSALPVVHQAQVAKHVVKSVANVIKMISDPAQFDAIFKAGAGYGSVAHVGNKQAYDIALAKTLPRSKERVALIAKQNLGSVRGFLNANNKLSAAFENAVRINYFESMIQKSLSEGKTEAEAVDIAVQAFNKMGGNFSQKGAFTAKAGRNIAFLTAGISGETSMVRAFLKDKGKFTAKALMDVTIPMLYLYYKNKDKEWYKNLPHREKTQSFNFSEHIKMPIPRGLLGLFASVPIDIMDAINNDSPEAVNNLLGSIFQALPYGQMPLSSPVTAALGVWGNKDPYFRTPLDQQNQADMYRGAEAWKRETNSPSAKFLASKTKVLSGNEISFINKTLFGNWGDTMQGLADKAISKASGVEMPKRKIESIPVVGKFLRSSPEVTGYSENIRKFWDRKNRIDAAVKSVKNAAVEAGLSKDDIDGYDVAELLDYVKDPKEQAKYAMLLDAKEKSDETYQRLVNDDGNNIFQIIKGVYSDREMSAEEKRAQLEEAYRVYNEVVKDANEDFIEKWMEHGKPKIYSWGIR
jgi:hypothetical protein